jgi:hypothetical protein
VINTATNTGVFTHFPINKYVFIDTYYTPQSLPTGKEITVSSILAQAIENLCYKNKSGFVKCSLNVSSAYIAE